MDLRSPFPPFTPEFGFFGPANPSWKRKKHTHLHQNPNAKPEYTIPHSVSKAEGTKFSLLGRKRRRCQSQIRSSATATATITRTRSPPTTSFRAGTRDWVPRTAARPATGDICLENIYCLNKELNVTYIAGCSDPNYEIDSCFDHYHEREFGRGTIVAGMFYFPYFVEPPSTSEKKNSSSVRERRFIFPIHAFLTMI